jgi:hypothetical protein|tara:strand:+ start:431 stop:709 length:279 start_codon:yes stop_codon:yes gene_type:complete
MPSIPPNSPKVNLSKVAPTNGPYEVRTTQVTLTPKGEAIFSEHAVHVRIVDEAAGEFIEVAQEEGTIRIDRDEWPYLRAAIEGMVAQCKDQD